MRSVAVRACLALVVFALGHILVVATVPFVFFRYAITLFPVFALLQAWAIRALATRSRVLAAAILLLALLPDRADLVHGRFSVTLARYVDEITHHVPGPIDGIVRHLDASARPGDRLFISYGDLPLRFYTRLEIRGGQGCQSLAGWPPPDWVIVRYFFRFQPAAPAAKQDAERTLQYLKTGISQSAYRRIDLPVVDTIWENIPEPDRHVFRDPGRPAEDHRVREGAALRPRLPAWLAVATVVTVAAAIRLRLLDVPLDRDEGEYAYFGQLLLAGVPPYALAYNLKLPGIYGVYALILAVFGQTPAGIRTGLILTTSATTVATYLLGARLAGSAVGVAAAAVVRGPVVEPKDARHRRLR